MTTGYIVTVKTNLHRVVLQIDGDNSILKIDRAKFWEPLDNVLVCQPGSPLEIIGLEDPQILSLGIVKRVKVRQVDY